MAENVKVRGIKEILEELFKDALEKYALMRIMQYWLTRWCCFGLPLSDVDRSIKAHFSKSFLGGVRIDQADEKTLREGFKRLDHAVADGCHNRCYRLVEELNVALEEMGLKKVDIEPFLDWLTFCYVPLRGGDGELIEEKPYGFPILRFYDKQNRKEFWAETQLFLKEGRMANMQYIASIVLSKRVNTVTIEK